MLDNFITQNVLWSYSSTCPAPPGPPEFQGVFLLKTVEETEGLGTERGEVSWRETQNTHTHTHPSYSHQKNQKRSQQPV